jgi:ankyrin repeat protein
MSALFEAVEAGRLEEVQRLLASGEASVADTDPDGETALHRAAMFGKLDIVQWLVQHGGADIGARTRYNGVSALLHAAGCGHLNVVQWLLVHGSSITERSDAGDTALLCAAINGKLEVLQWLLAHGSSITERSDAGDTALLCAAGWGELEVVQWLLAHGSSITERSNAGRTALLCAAVQGELEVVQWLLRYGGASITDLIYGDSVWVFVRDNLNKTPVDQLTALLKVMIARGAAPPSFATAVPPALRPLLAQGVVIRPRLPADSLWRAQRTTALQASDCGHCLAPAVLGVLGGYAEVSEEELWEMLAQEQAQAPTS